jgi:hypothetical protein
MVTTWNDEKKAVLPVALLRVGGPSQGYDVTSCVGMVEWICTLTYNILSLLYLLLRTNGVRLYNVLYVLLLILL